MKKMHNAITFLFVLVILTSCSPHLKTNNNFSESIETVHNCGNTDQKNHQNSDEEVHTSPPQQVYIKLEGNEFLNILNLLEEDEKEVEKYLNSNDVWDYDMNGLNTKADVIKMKNVIETTGFAYLSDGKKIESGYICYKPETCEVFTSYVVDGIRYQFVRENTTKTFDYSKYKYSDDCKSFAFNGTNGIMFNAYDEFYPQRKNVYYGRFITEGYTIAVRVFNCVDIECVDLEQFEWSNDIYTLEKLSINN